MLSLLENTLSPTLDQFTFEYDKNIIEKMYPNADNLPWNNISYAGINSIGRQWIRQYTFALSKEVLGLVRSKFGSIPIPNGDLQLNGSDLLSQAQSEKEKLITNLKEMLDSMTYDKLLEGQAAEVGNMQTILKAVPIPLGKVITIG